MYTMLQGTLAGFLMSLEKTMVVLIYLPTPWQEDIIAKPG